MWSQRGQAAPQPSHTLFLTLARALVLTRESFPVIHGLRKATTIVICPRSVELSHLRHPHALGRGHLPLLVVTRWLVR